MNDRENGRTGDNQIRTLRLFRNRNFVQGATLTLTSYSPPGRGTDSELWCYLLTSKTNQPDSNNVNSLSQRLREDKRSLPLTSWIEGGYTRHILNMVLEPLQDKADIFGSTLTFAPSTVPSCGTSAFTPGTDPCQPSYTTSCFPGMGLKFALSTNYNVLCQLFVV